VIDRILSLELLNLSNEDIATRNKIIAECNLDTNNSNAQRIVFSCIYRDEEGYSIGYVRRSLYPSEMEYVKKMLSHSFSHLYVINNDKATVVNLKFEIKNMDKILEEIYNRWQRLVSAELPEAVKRELASPIVKEVELDIYDFYRFINEIAKYPKYVTPEISVMMYHTMKQQIKPTSIIWMLYTYTFYQSSILTSILRAIKSGEAPNKELKPIAIYAKDSEFNKVLEEAFRKYNIKVGIDPLIFYIASSGSIQRTISDISTSVSDLEKYSAILAQMILTVSNIFDHIPYEIVTPDLEMRVYMHVGERYYDVTLRRKNGELRMYVGNIIVENPADLGMIMLEEIIPAMAEESLKSLLTKRIREVDRLRIAAANDMYLLGVSKHDFVYTFDKTLAEKIEIEKESLAVVV